MSRKVLIVDDSKLARMAVVRVLSGLHSDWSTEEAANADQALASFKQNTPDFQAVNPQKRVPALVLDGGGSVAWVVGMRIDRRFAAGPETRQALEVRVEPL